MFPPFFLLAMASPVAHGQNRGRTNRPTNQPTKQPAGQPIANAQTTCITTNKTTNNRHGKESTNEQATQEQRTEQPTGDQQTTDRATDKKGDPTEVRPPEMPGAENRLKGAFTLPLREPTNNASKKPLPLALRPFGSPTGCSPCAMPPTPCSSVFSPRCYL